MKLTIKQWNQLINLAQADYTEKRRRYVAERERLEGTEETPYLQGLFKQQSEANDLWYELRTQQI